MSTILPRFDFRAAFGAASDKGSRRAHYEDAALVVPEIALFAVADGMGGHQAGEVASRLAVETVRRVLSGREAQRTIDTYVAKADLVTRRAVYLTLRRAFDEANQAVLEDAAANETHRGMGTTLDVVWLARGNAFVAHAGDGRIYLARTRTMVQLTQDHTTSSGSSSNTQRRSAGITNAIGLADQCQIDTLFVDLARNDRLLLCTDGVHGQVEAESELSELLRSGSAEQGAGSLVARAGEQGRDNAT